MSTLENPSIKRLEVDVAADGRLWVHMDSTGTYNFVAGGDAMQSRATRTQEFWFERDGKEWKIDGCQGRSSALRHRPRRAWR